MIIILDMPAPVKIGVIVSEFVVSNRVTWEDINIKFIMNSYNSPLLAQYSYSVTNQNYCNTNIDIT